MIIIDTKKKLIELFEPHGKRNTSTTMDSLVGAYNISDKLIKKYFKKYFPEYKYISPKVNFPSYGLQAKVDAFNGMCVTYCIMYLHEQPFLWLGCLHIVLSSEYYRLF